MWVMVAEMFRKLQVRNYFLTEKNKNKQNIIIYFKMNRLWKFNELFGKKREMLSVLTDKQIVKFMGIIFLLTKN